jgi:hypothetical protein
MQLIAINLINLGLNEYIFGLFLYLIIVTNYIKIVINIQKNNKDKNEP